MKLWRRALPRRFGHTPVSHPSLSLGGRAVLETKAHMQKRSGRATRVDAAHSTSGGALPKAAAPARAQLAVLAGVAQPGSTDATIADQLQRQSMELGDRLQQRQRELDQREASFHAQIAQLESELRSARLVQQELQEELLARAQTIKRREEELDREAADLLHAESAQRAEAGEQFTSASQLNETAKLTAEQWRRRITELDRSEHQLQAQLSDLAHKQQALDKERQVLIEANAKRDERVKRERQEEQHRFENELMRLRKRQEEVERRAISVQQLHQDTCNTYRETLELRIATEQIWAEFHGGLSTVELTRRLATWRKKLMDQFALASESLKQQQVDNLALLHSLEKQTEGLNCTRNELREWMSRRQQELIEEAEKLLTRERELSREEARFRHLEQQWAAQQAGYEQEIRRLRRLAQS